MNSDAFYVADHRALVHDIEKIEGRTVEISRCLASKADPRDLIDSAVKLSVETKALLDRFALYEGLERKRAFMEFSSRLETAVRSLEGVVGSYFGGHKIHSALEKKRAITKNANPFTPGSTASVSEMIVPSGFSLDDGLKKETLSDLKRVEKEMVSLQSIYQALHNQTLEQHSAIETIGGNLFMADAHTDDANKALLITQASRDRSLRWKLYAASFIVFVIFLYIMIPS